MLDCDRMTLARALVAHLLCVPVLTWAQTTGAAPPGPTALESQIKHEQFVNARACLGKTATSIREYQAREICDAAHMRDCVDLADGKNATGEGKTSEQQAICPSSDPDVLEKQYHAAVEDAASRGFADAQICYIQGEFRLTSPAEIDKYRRTSKKYIEEGLQRGDWRVVYLLATPMDSAAHGLGAMSSLDFIGRPFTVYRATQLLMLGADDKYRKELAARTEFPSRFLSKAQADKARLSARNLYRAHFINSPVLHNDLDVCP
ncbi:hypothetical protein ACFWZU_00010 [Frateuria sp. GZRR33]|uniref:hypothetical protein n=1 Tax=Frateuria sp. GZRR33 TaxID=3351535 RepID=UPI003EDCA399